MPNLVVTESQKAAALLNPPPTSNEPSPSRASPRSALADEILAAVSAMTGPPLPLIIKAQRLDELIGIPQRTIYEMEERNEFPRRIQIGPRAVGWVRDEILVWLAERKLARDGRASGTLIPSPKRKPGRPRKDAQPEATAST